MIAKLIVLTTVTAPHNGYASRHIHLFTYIHMHIYIYIYIKYTHIHVYIYIFFFYIHILIFFPDSHLHSIQLVCFIELLLHSQTHELPFNTHLRFQDVISSLFRLLRQFQNVPVTSFWRIHLQRL